MEVTTHSEQQDNSHIYNMKDEQQYLFCKMK